MYSNKFFNHVINKFISGRSITKLIIFAVPSGNFSKIHKPIRLEKNTQIKLP
jgi:hypothetical protein